MRRIALLQIVLILFVCATSGFLWVCHRSPNQRFSVAKYGLLQTGMTLREVEAALGGPPRDYGFGNGELLRGGFSMISESIFQDPISKRWVGNSE